MEEIKNVLEKLGVLKDIAASLLNYNIEQTDENFAKSGFGFARITESFSSILVLKEEIYNFINNMRDKQDKELMEQQFALTGNLGIGGDGKPIICLLNYIEDTTGIKRTTSTRGGEDFYKKINEYVNNNEDINKVLLLGHTHPDIDKLLSQDDFSDEIVNIREATESLPDNPLKLRKRGLNVSFSDISQLINAQNSASRENFILLGIVLPNGELNVLFYNGRTIQSLDEIYVIRGESLEPIPTFRNDNQIVMQ